MDTKVDFKEPLSLEDQKRLEEDMLISIYVPEAEYLSREEALQLAAKRDHDAAMTLEEDCLEGAPF